MSTVQTDVMTPGQTTPDQLVALNQAARTQATRFVQAVTRLAATHPDIAQQLVQTLGLIATNTETLGTEAAIVPKGVAWEAQPGFIEMRKMQNFSEATPANLGYKQGDGGHTCALPDGRWLSTFGDTLRGSLHRDGTMRLSGITRPASRKAT